MPDLFNQKLRIIHDWVVILFVYLQSGLVAVGTHKGDLFKSGMQVH